jgi:hypothetical protein
VLSKSIYWFKKIKALNIKALYRLDIVIVEFYIFLNYEKMETGMDQILSAKFEGLKGKVVDTREYRKKEVALLKEQGLKEKAFRHLIDNPRLLLGVIAHPIKEVKAVMALDAYEDLETKKRYADADEVAKFEASLSAGKLHKSFHKNLLMARLYALESCEDHSPRVKSGELKPLKP